MDIFGKGTLGMNANDYMSVTEFTYAEPCMGLQEPLRAGQTEFVWS